MRKKSYAIMFDEGSKVNLGWIGVKNEDKELNMASLIVCHVSELHKRSIPCLLHRSLPFCETLSTTQNKKPYDMNFAWVLQRTKITANKPP